MEGKVISGRELEIRRTGCVLMEKTKIQGALHRASACNSPFLARESISRTTESEIPGYYCERKQMWVIDTPRGPVPIIIAHSLQQTSNQLRDSGEKATYDSLELLTKTRQERESDDDSTSLSNELIQLLTKTETVREADDNYETSNILELVTKTDTQKEVDDDGF
ncbi:hypothetical protein [Haliea sp.]|jgi:hypothetical protein|uniref:hypothetical protein n=1 Tax=Haliea sp. TaxID=1932666 RepID=UPI00257FC358|nr:hypothetical protein [Haliea sp.]|tara:strand:- start:6172 stop:6666 length:495 start_codon:yes stop_codon:yes gene_type:complete